MRNKLFKSYIIVAFALVFGVSAMAQTSDYAKLNKTASYNYETQRGEITLESYVTGVSKVTQEAKPLEILMVLDYSTSMSQTYSSSDTYTKVSATTRYYAGNTKVSGSFLNSSSADITDGLLQNGGGTQIQVKYGSTNYNVYVTRRGSTYYWCYIMVGGKRVFIRMDGSFMEESGTATIGSSSSKWPKGVDGFSIVPTTSNDRVFFSVLGESSGTAITTRTDALRAAASNFIDEIYTHAINNAVTDKVGIIAFQGGGTTKYPAVYKVNTDYDADYTSSSTTMFLAEYPSDKKGTGSQDGSLQGRTFVSKRFTDITSQDAPKILKYAISDVTASGQTYVSQGLTIAQTLINANARSDSNLEKIVIIFSDGDPSDDKTTSVGLTKTLKDSGWKIYTVYCHSSDPSSATATFMEAMSSNYPDATSTSSLGDKNTKDNIEYYKTAKQDLNTVFDKLTNEVTTMAGIKYGTETLLKDFVNNTYFKMPEGITSYDVKVYEQLCTGMSGTSPNITYSFNDVCIDSGTGANRLWHKGSTENPTSPIEIIINQVGVTPGYTGTQDQVLISGYDYSDEANWCGLHKTTSNPSGFVTGHRLVVKFPYEIKVQSGQTATGALETNGSDSGIYEAKEDASGKNAGDEGYIPTYDSTPETVYPMPVVYFASINITRKNLDEGESAIYDIYQTLSGGTETKVGRLSINGSGSKNDSKIMYGLAGGVGVSYRVVETNWNWAYHDGGTLPQQSQTIAAAAGETTVPASSNLNFTFSGAHQKAPTGTEATSPFSTFNHDEEFKVNKLAIPKPEPLY